MNCATHNDIAAVAFCRTCGKALCASCTRDVRGVIYCESCLAARLDGTAPAAAFVPPAQTVYPPIGTPVGRPAVGVSSGPNPAVAGILAGFFPFGVGAVYCSQYAKGLSHLVVFVLMIVGLSSNLPWFVDTVLGISLGLFYFYQIFDAVRTAKALQLGEPAPDPLGLAQSFSMGDKFDAGRVPVGAVLLIGLGVLFLLHTLGIMEYGFERYWPLILIFLGGWMFYRHWECSSRKCTCARCRTRWLMGPAMVLTTGFLFLFHTMNIADLDRTWPAWILVVGIVKLLQSSASSAGHVGPLPPGPASGAPPPPQPPVSGPGQTPSSGEVRNV
jgi:Domain of unknown function (DUF5668)